MPALCTLHVNLALISGPEQVQPLPVVKVNTGVRGQGSKALCHQSPRRHHMPLLHQKRLPSMAHPGINRRLEGCPAGFIKCNAVLGLPCKCTRLMVSFILLPRYQALLLHRSPGGPNQAC